MTVRRFRRLQGISPRTWMALVLVAGLLALGAILPAGAKQHGGNHAAKRPPSDEAKGLVYDRLEVKEHGPCRNGFRVRVGDRSIVCTPGPDPAPRGINVTEPRDTGSMSTTASDTG